MNNRADNKEVKITIEFDCSSRQVIDAKDPQELKYSPHFKTQISPIPNLLRKVEES